MIYGYTSGADENEKNTAIIEIQNYAKVNNLALKKVFEDVASTKKRWENRVLSEFINTGNAGDQIIVYDAPSIARSISQILEIFDVLTSKSIKMYFIKYGRVFRAETKTSALELVQLLRQIENDYVCRRTRDAVARRREAGLPLGRPKGRPNKHLKLDKYRKEIQGYLDLRVSKVAIAKLIGCHVQTLYNYIAARDLVAKPAAEKQSHRVHYTEEAS